MIKKLNPNYLTFLRILLLPLPCGLLFLDFWETKVLALVLIACLALTDYVDGKLARKYKKNSLLGAKLDPIADKIFVVSMLLVLQHLGYFPYFPVFLIVLRETIILYLRNYFFVHLKVSFISKLKTFFQMITIILIVFLDIIGIEVKPFIKDFLIWMVVGLAYVSGFYYICKVYKEFLKFIKKSFINFITSFIYEVGHLIFLVLIYPFTYKLFWLVLIFLGFLFLKFIEPVNEGKKKDFKELFLWDFSLIGVTLLELLYLGKVEISLIFWVGWMIFNQKFPEITKNLLITLFSCQEKG